MSMAENGNDRTAADSLSLHRLQPQTIVSPRSVTALILRMRALVSEWVKAEIDEDSIRGADGIVTESVVKTFLLAGGDLSDAVPFALLESRKDFMRYVLLFPSIHSIAAHECILFTAMLIIRQEH